jgi:hypothetical protein
MTSGCRVRRASWRCLTALWLSMSLVALNVGPACANDVPSGGLPANGVDDTTAEDLSEDVQDKSSESMPESTSTPTDIEPLHQVPNVQGHFVDRWVADDETLQLQVRAEVFPQWPRWRVFIGDREVTPLLRAGKVPGQLQLDPMRLRWPAGESELRLVDGQSWDELARLPLRVLTAGGFESSSLSPRLDMSTDSRARERRNDGQALSPRGTYVEAASQAGFAWQALRGDWQFEAGANTSGHSDRNKALRFGELAARAPKLDLADYRVAVAHAGHQLQLGHLTAPTHPLLAQELVHRGVALRGLLGDAGQLSLHVLNGSQIVGWDNPLGLAETQHRMQLLSWGFELLPARPGGLRAELGLLDAAVLARRDFNVGEVPDVERSRGVSLHVSGQTESGRVRGNLAIARSRFVNPFDPELALDGQLQPVQPTTRTAWTGELQADVLVPQGDAAWQPALTLRLRHEQAAPLYRSLAAAVTPDQRTRSVSLQLALEDAQLSLQHLHRVDNLDLVPTLLRTRTIEQRVSTSVPLARWLGDGSSDSPWPAVAWSWQAVHQRAVNAPAPEDSGFGESQRPDQRTVSQQLGLSWLLSQGAASWTLSRQTLDNRQPGRELADTDNRSQQWQLEWTFNPRWQGQWTLQRGRQYQRETDLAQRVAALTAGLDWRPDERWSLGVQVGLNRTRDRRGQLQTRSSTGQVQLARRFDLPAIDKPLPAQWTLRLGRQLEHQRDDRFALATDWRGWWIDIGLAVGFF